MLLNALCFPDFFLPVSKKGIKDVQILKMKTICMFYDTLFCLFYYYFYDSGSAGQMHS